MNLIPWQFVLIFFLFVGAAHEVWLRWRDGQPLLPWND